MGISKLRKAMRIVGRLTTDCPMGGQCQYTYNDKGKTVTGSCRCFAGTHEDERGLFVRCDHPDTCPS